MVLFINPYPSIPDLNPSVIVVIKKGFLYVVILLKNNDIHINLFRFHL